MAILNSVQRNILQGFGKIPDSGRFYLTGGTALAYFYLKHRRSRDLDFFTSFEEIILPFSRRLEDTFRENRMTVERQRGTHSFVEFFVRGEEETTIVQLAQDAPFRFEPTKEFQEFPGLQVDSLVDIASNKLLALFGRAALRDFVDLYFLIKEGGFSQKDLIEKAKKKDPGFELYWLGVALEQIKTFKQDSPEIEMLLKPVRFQILLDFFSGWRNEISGTLRS